MICPKCRTKYGNGVTVCPDCNVELVGLMGAADAPSDAEIAPARKLRRRDATEIPSDAPVNRMQKTVIDESDSFSPVVYKSTPDENGIEIRRSNPAAVFLLVLSLLFIAASAVMFYMGSRQGATSQLFIGFAGQLRSIIGGTLPF